MINNSLKITYFLVIIIFIYFVISNYFSKDNILKINNNILDIKKRAELREFDLPIIQNDTDDVIIYNQDSIIQKKFKKRKIWDLLN